MVHRGPPDRKGGGRGAAKLDQSKGGSNVPKASTGRCQHHQQKPYELQDDAYRAAAAAAIADMRQVLKKARAAKRISDSSLKQVERFSTPSPKKNPRWLTPAPAPGSGAAAEWSSAPNYMKATTSSDARTGKQPPPPPQQVSKAQPLFATPADNKRRSVATPRTLPSHTPPPTSAPGRSGGGGAGTTPKKPKSLLLTRKPSLKLVVIPASTATTKALVAAPLFENIAVSKATCSSTLKDHNFPTELELNPGGTQLDGTSVLRVCPYTYCSLNGHHAPAVPLRYFLSAKRRMIKAQNKGVKIRRLPSPRKRVVGITTDDDAGIEREDGFENEISPQSTVLDGRNDDYFLEIYVNRNQGEDNGDSGFDGEVNNGDGSSTSNNNDGLGSEADEPPHIVRDDVDLDTTIPPNGPTTSYAEMSLIDDIIDRLSEISVSEVEVPTWFMPNGETLDREEETPDADFFTSSINGDGKHNKSNDDDGFALGEFLLQQPVQEQPSLTPSEAVEVDWQEEMPEYADDAVADEDEHDQGTAGENDDDDDDISTPVKADIIIIPVAEDAALEKSLTFPGEKPAESEQLLPEIDSDSGTGFSVDRKGCDEEDIDPLREFNPRGPNFLPLVPEPELEKVDLRHPMLDERKTAQEDVGTEAITNDSIVAEDGHSDIDNQMPSTDIITPVAEDETSLSCPQGKHSIQRAATKPQQPLPEMDTESRLKLVISRRSHEEYEEELGEFNPRGPNFLPLEPDPEAEKVDLRHQMMDDRKNAEEWMVDYALQRAVSKLAPARKKKVALLVEAFETVAPPPPIYKSRIPLRRHSSLGFEHVRPMQACS